MEVKLINYSDSDMSFWVNTSIRAMTIEGGQIGIGTAAPSAKIHSYASTNGFCNGLNIENPNAGSSASAGMYLTAQNTLDVTKLNNLSGDFGYLNTSGTLYDGTCSRWRYMP